jgi:rare lipoprotein A (peptidoglycan hydrolase)
MQQDLLSPLGNRLVGCVWIATSLLLALAFGVGIHSSALSSGTPPELTETKMPMMRTWDLEAHWGVASWYGKPFHGRRTADGTVYDMGGYSVANKDLPLGTFVWILNLDNGRTCCAVVNDRGPYVAGRDWDVSAAVAGRLGMVWKGTARVKVKEIK